MAFSFLTREQLYELVWSEPMLKVAALHDVSSSYMEGRQPLIMSGFFI